MKSIYFKNVSKIDLEKLKISRGEIVIVKRPKGIEEDRWNWVLNELAGDIASYVGFPVMIIGVDKKFSEITKISEENMAPYGWVPKSRVLAMIDDPIDEIVEKINRMETWLQIDSALGGEEE